MFICHLSITSYLINICVTQNVSLFREILASEICNGASCKVSSSAGKTIEGNLAATKFIIVQCQAGCWAVSWQLVVIINYFVTGWSHSQLAEICYRWFCSSHTASEFIATATILECDINTVLNDNRVVRLTWYIEPFFAKLRRSLGVIAKVFPLYCYSKIQL